MCIGEIKFCSVKPINRTRGIICYACVHAQVLWSCGLFETLWTVAHPCQAPLSMGFSRKECWSGLPCPPPGDLPDTGIERPSLACPTLAGKLFTTRGTWEAHCLLQQVAAATREKPAAAKTNKLT